MKKFAKMLCSFIFAILMCTSVLTGCNWTELNKEKYYNQTVVVADDYKFTKRDLIAAFNSYGYQYLQNGADAKTAVENTINSMVQRKLLVENIKPILAEAGLIKSNATFDGDFELKELDKSEVLYNTYENMRSTIAELEDGIYEEWDLYRNDKIEETVDPLRAVKEDYEVKINYDFNTNTISRVDDTKKFDKETPATFQAYMTSFIDNEDVYKKAWAQYLKGLQSSAKNEGRKIDEKSVLAYEQDRIYKLLEENKYLSLYENYFFINSSIDTESVVKYYKETYKSQLNYIDDSDAYYSAMSESSEGVFYHPTYNGEVQYINVDHILIKFNAYQLEELARVSNEYGWDIKTSGDENEKYTESYPEWIEHLDVKEVKDIIDMTECTYEQNGETKTMKASELLSYVRSYYNSKVTSSSDLSEKAKAFDDMKYMFNDDSGNMNKDFNYVVNYTTNTKDIMVKTFTDKSRELYDNSNGERGILDTEWTVSNYGLHLIFYMKPVESIKNESAIDTINVSDLFANYVNPSSNKTLFHYIYEKLSLDNNLYNAHATDIITNAMSELTKYETYSKNYKDLYEG